MEIEALLARLAAGDAGALDELLAYACERLRDLTRRMLRCFPDVRRWEQTDDVFQNALLRLCRSLREVLPQSEQHFYRLAALHVRRELIDLARHHGGPQGAGSNLASNAGEDGVRPPAYEQAHEWSPERLAKWAEFHEQVERLPEEMREVIDLRIYHGCTHEQAAARLGVATRTVQRREAEALRRLYEALGGEMPG